MGMVGWERMGCWGGGGGGVGGGGARARPPPPRVLDVRLWSFSEGFGQMVGLWVMSGIMRW